MGEPWVPPRDTEGARRGLHGFPRGLSVGGDLGVCAGGGAVQAKWQAARCGSSLRPTSGRVVRRADRLGDRAAGVEPAAGRTSIGLGGSPTTAADSDARPGTSRGTAFSRPCVYGWRGFVKSSSVGGRLDDPAQVHHRDPVAHVADDGHVVGDEEHRQAQLLAQLVEQVQHGRLHRHVERRDRLVGHQQLGLERERAGDRDALALAAGEVARDGSRAPGPAGRPAPAAPGSGRRRRSAAPSRARAGARRASGGRSSAGSATSTDPGRPSGSGAARTAARFSCRAQLARVADLAGRRRVQADDAAAERRLAAARLADEPERLAGHDLEVDAVDGAQHLGRARAARGASSSRRS